MSIGLFIGRFQPFHQGHLDALKQISENEIIIGIGSSQYSRTEENPWTFEERKQMIIESLTNEHIKYSIVAIPDIHDEAQWVEHVKKTVDDFDVVYTGNQFVRKLFEEKGYEVKKIETKIKITGTELRRMIKNNDSSWQSYVSPRITNLIQNLG